MSDNELFKKLNKKVFKDQAVWMLNALWPTKKDTVAEEIWNFTKMFAEFEIENHEEGCDLDELNMHRVFEKLNCHKTVQEMRTHLRSAGVESFKRIGMLHFLSYYYEMDWKAVAHAPQGDNSEQIEKAQKLLDEVSKQLAECETKAAEAKKSATAAAAKQKEAEAAEAEVTKALNDVKAQEEAKENKRAALQKKIETAGLVARNAAIQELAKLDSEDDLPLRRAKTTLEAAQRKAAKATKAATEAREKADADSKSANEAVELTQKKVVEAEEYLKEVEESSGAAGKGTMWWMQRELEEKKKFMPARKGGLGRSLAQN